MNKIFLIALFFICCISTSFSQKTLSDYSYVIVSEQFSFQNEKDKYQLNSLTKFLFNKYGFNAYFNNEVPSNVKRCDGLWAEAEGSPGFIYTTIEVVLTDCNGLTVFRSNQGKSKDKDYKKAYYEAMRETFLSIESLSVNQKEIATSEIKLLSKGLEAKKNNANLKTVEAGVITKNATETKSSVIKEIKSEAIPEKSITNTDIEATKIVAGVVIADKAIDVDNSEKLTEAPRSTPKENLPSEKYTNYSYLNKTFLLRKTSNGYSFYEETTDLDEELYFIGKIEVIDTTLIFIDKNSMELQAYFDDSKNLIIINDETTITYKIER